MKKIIFIILLSAFPLVCFAQETTAPASPEQPLRLSLKSDKEVYGVGEEMIFFVDFRNAGEKDFILNLGEMLGNGVQIPSKINFELTAEDGKKSVYSYHGRIPGVRGSLDFLGIPLKTEALYRLQISSKDFLLGTVPPGSYQTTCFYQGTQTELRNPTHIKFWEGKVTSNKIEFKIIEKD